MNINRLTISGNTTDTPRVYTTQTGKKVCTFTLVTNRFVKKNDDGTIETTPDFHRVTAWEQLADIAINNIRKGSYIMIEGSLHYKTYEKDGIKFTNAQITARMIQPLAKLQRDEQTNHSEAQSNNNQSDPSENLPPEEVLNSAEEFIPADEPFDDVPF